MADISEKARAFFRDHGDLINLQGKFQTRAALEAYAQRHGIVLPENASEFLIAQQEIKQDEPAELPSEPAKHKEGIHSHAEKEPARPPRTDIGQSYRNAVENTVADWNRANRNNPGSQFKGDIFTWDKQGKLVLNQDAVAKIPNLAQRGEDIVRAMHGEQDVNRYQRWQTLDAGERLAVMRFVEQEQTLRPSNPAELKQAIAARTEAAASRQIITMQASDRQQGITRPGGKDWYEKQVDRAKLMQSAQQQSIGQFLRLGNGRAIREALRDPELGPLIETYREQLKEAVRRAKEDTRLKNLRSPKNDIRLAQIQTGISTTTEAEYSRQRAAQTRNLTQESWRRTITQGATPIDRSAIEKAEKEKIYDRFVRQNPNQARHYARRDPNIKAAYERYQAQQALAKKQYEEAQKLTKKRGLLGRTWRRVRPIKRVYLPLPGQPVPEAVIPSRWQRFANRFNRFNQRFDPVRNTYDDFRDWRDRVYDKYSPTRFIPRGYERLKDRFQQTRLGKWLKSKHDAYLSRKDRLANWWDRMSPARRLQRRFRNSSFYKNTFGRYNAFKKNLSAFNQKYNPYEIAKRWLRNLRRQIANAIKNAIKNAFKALGRGIAQGARFMAPILGRALKNLGSAAARGAKKLAGRAAGAAANAMSKMAEQLTQRLAMLAAQGIARLAGAALFSNPVTAGITITVIIILLFVLTTMLSSEEENQPIVTPSPTTASVTIDKRAEKEAVGNDEVIRYTITIKPQGAADDITITDIVLANATFDSADRQPQVTEGPEGTTILTWSLKEIQEGLGSPPPPPADTAPFEPDPNSQGTVHNLGFGPSDAERIENMIRNQFPRSPLLGHGAEIIEFAKEFNMDPLMVVLMKTETQFCTDTGVGSPGGSEPDNFNCGNIKWGAAEGQTDTSRWHAQSGPKDALNNVFTFVPNPRDGIGLFFDYISADFYRGKDLYEFYSIYNDCTESAPAGFACGPTAVDSMLQYLRENAGTPVNSSGVAASATEFKPLTIILTLKPKPDTINTYVVNKVRAEIIGGTTASDCVVTKVGSPAGPKPTCPGETGQQPEPPGQPSGPCQAPPQNYSTKEEYMREINVKWGIEVWGELSVEQLKWIWEEFWGVDCTGFLQALEGTQIKGYTRGDGVSFQNPADRCPNDAEDPAEEPNIYFNNALGESGVKVLIIHEMTHVWQTCVDNGTTNRGGIEEAISKDGSKLTTYSRDECAAIPVSGVDENSNPWDNSLNEDHAETIAYYLNPDQDEITCGHVGPNPYQAGNFLGHASLAEQGVGKEQ